MENAAPALRIRLSRMNSPTTLTGSPGVEVGQGPGLGDLVGDVGHDGRDRQEAEQAAAVRWGSGGGGGLVGRDQRRSCFVLHVTHRVARGAA